MNQIVRLQSWYEAQCNGDWEHSYGVKIDTLDNPGWLLQVDLTGTNLQDKAFSQSSRGNAESETDWMHCKVESGKFQAAGGAKNLPDMLEAFLEWAGY